MQCFADASRRRPLAAHALVLAGRHARGRRVRQPRCARQDLPAWRSRRRCRRRRASPPRSRCSFRSRSAWSGATARDLPLKLAGGASVERGILSLRKSVGSLCFRRHCRAAGDVAQPQFLRAGAHGRQPVRRRPALPGGARLRSVQSLAGDAVAGDAPAGRQRRGDPLRRRHAPRRRPARRARRDPRRRVARARVRRARADPAERGRHRPRDRPRRRSRCDLHRALARCATQSGSISPRALQDRYRSLADTGPYRPDAAGAGRRALRNTCLDLMVAARARARSRSPRSNIATPTT